MESINLKAQKGKPSQVIDANLDRAREGLRVIEDWCRFYLTTQEQVITLKDWRQKLGLLHSNKYKFARSISTDQGLGLTHQAQTRRKTSEELISANCSRVQEALRVLEEFSRRSDPLLAKTAVEIRYGLYELEVNILKLSIYRKRFNNLKTCELCLITKPHKSLLKVVTQSLQAGVRMIQYRSKDCSDHKKYLEAKEISKICKEFNALFIINDRIDLAIAVNADGVHLGQDDMPTKIARELIGEEMLIGKSTHSTEEIKAAQNEGCDYLGIGPFEYSNKKPELKALGLDNLKEIASKSMLPWFAIGGINSNNLKGIKSSGVSKVAVIDAIMNDSDPYQATKTLIKYLK